MRDKMREMCFNCGKGFGYHNGNTLACPSNIYDINDPLSSCDYKGSKTFFKKTEFDFEDGNGPVAAKRHINPDGSVGGWVADSAIVEPSATVRFYAQVYGEAEVFGDAQVYGFAKIFNKAKVYDKAKVHGIAEIHGNAEVFGFAEIWNSAKIYDNAFVGGQAKVFGKSKIKADSEISGGLFQFGFCYSDIFIEEEKELIEEKERVLENV